MRSILIVDDDPAICEALATALTPRYHVSTAFTALTALDVLCNSAVDLVLLDYSLPDFPGTAILEAIKRYFSSIPVIFMTAFSTEDLAILALRGGVRDYIRKPFDVCELHARIHTLLEAHPRTVPSIYPSESSGSKSLIDLVLKTEMQGNGILRGLCYIEAHLERKLSLSLVAREAGMSKHYFCRRFKSKMGLSFREYLARRRIARAKEMLRERSRTISEIIGEVGFKDMAHFGRVFRKIEGQLPSDFCRNVVDESSDRSDSHRPVGSTA